MTISSHRRQVIIGFLGTTLDRGLGAARWEHWRPTIDLCRQPDQMVDRLDLLYSRSHEHLMEMVRDDIRRISPETEVRPHVLDIQNHWDFEEVFSALHDLARAYEFLLDEEDYLVHITTGSHVAQICLFLLTESRHIPGRLIQTSPPRRQRSDETGSIQIIDLDLTRYDRLASRFESEHRDGVDFLKAGIETRNDAFNAMMAELETVAIRSKAPILLMGPTGAGKSALARRVYDLKSRRRQVEGPLVEINCATLRGDGAMSTLFGHQVGAFTGATALRPGLIRQADGGLLFLDEIGELGHDEQATLLHALEEKRFRPLGADHEIDSDFQLIAGTNRDLEGECRQGHFRLDLLTRIDSWSFRLPGLAKRPEDLEPNLDHELELFRRRHGVLVTMNREARQIFVDFAISPTASWPGNFRELNASVMRMATLAQGGRITQDVARAEILRLETTWSRSRVDPRDLQSRSLESAAKLLGEDAWTATDPFDQFQLAGVLHVCSRSRSLAEAGRELFAVSRDTRKSQNDSDRLRKYLGRFGLSFKDL